MSDASDAPARPAYHAYREEGQEARKARLRALSTPFTVVWQALAAEGVCDSLGGAEYARVHGEWLRAGRPTPPHGFIRWRANIGLDDVWSLVDRKERDHAPPLPSQEEQTEAARVQALALACPFCGAPTSHPYGPRPESRGRVLGRGWSQKSWVFACNMCGARGPGVPAPIPTPAMFMARLNDGRKGDYSYASALEAWNTREGALRALDPAADDET